MLARIITTGIEAWLKAERESTEPVGADRSGRLGTPQLPVFAIALELIYAHARGGTHASVTATPAAIAKLIERLNTPTDQVSMFRERQPLGYVGKTKHVTQAWNGRFEDAARSFMRVDVEGETYFLRFIVSNQPGGKGKLVAVQPYSSRFDGETARPGAPLATESLHQTVVAIDSDVPRIERFASALLLYRIRHPMSDQGFIAQFPFCQTTSFRASGRSLNGSCNSPLEPPEHSRSSLFYSPRAASSSSRFQRQRSMRK